MLRSRARIGPPSNWKMPRVSVVEAVRVAAVHAAPDLLAEPAFLGLPLRHRELGHQVGLGELDVGSLSDRHGGVAARLPLLVGADRAHLLRALEVVARPLEPEPRRVGQRGGGLHGEQHLVRGGIVRAGVVRVVGHHERQRQVPGNPAQAISHPVLDLQPVIHDLDEEVARPEDVTVGGSRGHGLVVLAQLQPGLHLTGGAAGGGDDALGVGREQFPVHPRLAEKAFERGQRGQPEQVVHALRGLGEQRHVGVRTGAGHVVILLRRRAPPHRLAEPAVLGRHIGLDPDDRLDARGARLGPEVVGAVDVAVVGDRDGRHARALAGAEHVLEPCGAVQHRVLGVHMQMHKPAISGGSGGSPPRVSTSALGEGTFWCRVTVPGPGRRHE
jgi:hypothetical protein